MKLLNAGCGTHYAQGWVNCDVWEDEVTRPDIKVEAGEPYPFEDSTFDAVYLGHVLEHIEWSKVGYFIDDMIRVSKPGAPMLIVGPDVHRTLQRWSQGQEPWHMVLSTMEHQEYNYQQGRDLDFWDGAHHHWNCYYQRVADILVNHQVNSITNYTDVITNDTGSRWWSDPLTGITWPVVAKWHWQFALHCFVN